MQYTKKSYIVRGYTTITIYKPLSLIAFQVSFLGLLARQNFQALFWNHGRSGSTLKAASMCLREVVWSWRSALCVLGRIVCHCVCYIECCAVCVIQWVMSRNMLHRVNIMSRSITHVHMSHVTQLTYPLLTCVMLRDMILCDVMRDMTHSHVWHAAFICITWLICERYMTRSHRDMGDDVWSSRSALWVLRCVTWLNLILIWLTHVRDMTPLWVCH